MDGAGSGRAANYVYTIAPKDGTVIGAVNQNAPMYQLLGGEGVQFDATRFNWLGSMAYSNGTLYTWHTFGVRSLRMRSSARSISAVPDRNPTPTSLQR